MIKINSKRSNGIKNLNIRFHEFYRSQMSSIMSKILDILKRKFKFYGDFILRKSGDCSLVIT